MRVKRTLLIFIDAKIDKICLHSSKKIANFAPANRKKTCYDPFCHL